jgi:hypothetical protein
MLDCADSADWESLELLERERNSSVTSCFSPPPDEDDSEAVTEAIAALLSLNDRVVQRVAEERNAIMNKIAGLQRGRDSRFCYDEIQGLEG